MTRPADYPPPFDPDEFVAAPTDPPEERIDVGVLIVGRPAGLACAIRLGQLLEDSPETAARLGEVPMAVLEKGKGVGAHLVSGAVVNPRGLRRLFRGRGISIEDVPSYGRVEHESVYFLNHRGSMRIPTPPTMRNDGNFVASLSELSRWLGEQAEAAGAVILPETTAEKLLLTGARTVGVRTGDKGRGRDGEPLPNFEPGSDVTAKVTVLAEGTQGHLTGIAIDRLGLAGENPQVWALGVKEVWKVARPLDRVIHTMGWPPAASASTASSAAPSSTRWVTTWSLWAWSSGSTTRTLSLGPRPAPGAEDAQARPSDPRGRRAHRLGREDDPGGRLPRVSAAVPRTRASPLRRRRRPSQRPGAEGDPLRDRVGPARGGSGVRGTPARTNSWTRGALASYDRSLRETYVWKDLERVRNMRPAFAHGILIGGAIAGAATASFGKLPPRDMRTEPDAVQTLIRTNRSTRYPVPDGKLTFDKLSSVYLSGNKTRDDAPNHVRVRTDVPQEIALLWERMCPAQVYEAKDGGVEVTPSNCVQCGAITAKGGA